MKIKWSALVQEGRGKLNGSVMSRNRTSNYVRNKTTPVNRNTTAQVQARQRLTTAAQSWRVFTQLERDSFNSGASEFKRNNIFGDQFTPSGIALYNRLNLNLDNINQPRITTAPQPASVEVLTAVSAAAAAGAATMTLTFAPAIAVGTSVIVRATAPLSPGINFVKSQFRIITVLTNADASPANIKAAYLAKFGSFPAAGSKIFFDVKPVEDASGIDSIPLQCFTIVAA